MRNKKAFSTSLELILIMALCAAVAIVALGFFSDNFSQLFTSERHYKGLFSREIE